jgi:acyl-CoA synthetase (AMP-forming)/AMP-acid ligase II
MAPPPAAPHSLRFIRSGSNALSEAIQLGLESALGIPVVQGYGMTETCSIAQNPLPPRERKTGSVGLALGAELMILSDDKEASRGDVIGEILVRGPSVMRGYEGDAEEEDFNQWAYRFWSPFNHVEMRDSRVVIFADHLPPGVHVTSFVARATTPGVFVMKPARGELMYEPEVWGRSEGGSFTVELPTSVTQK